MNDIFDNFCFQCIPYASRTLFSKCLARALIGLFPTNFSAFQNNNFQSRNVFENVCKTAAIQFRSRWLKCYFWICCARYCNAPSQWEATLQCNIISHWLGADTKWFLVMWKGVYVWVVLTPGKQCYVLNGLFHPKVFHLHSLRMR